MSVLFLALVLSVCYLLAIRFLDLNEREPVWATLLLFGLGLAAAGLLHMSAPVRVLELSIVSGAGLQEAAKLLAFLAGLAILGIASRARGWPEINGPMDGIVYGAAAGLGFALGESLSVELAVASTPVSPTADGALQGVPALALDGLAHGVSTALAGAAFVAGIRSRRRPATVALILVGLVTAFGVNAGLRVLAYGMGPGDNIAILRSWVALAFPLAALVGFVLVSLRRERATIAEQLEEEVASGGGIVGRSDVDLLGRPIARQLAYLTTLLRQGPAVALTLHALHTYQVKLALLLSSGRAEDDPEREELWREQIASLRRAIEERQTRLAALSAAYRPEVTR